jgi:hypothetical protein
MKNALLLCLLLATPGMAQNNRYKLTEKDTVLTCALTSRSILPGPFSDVRSADFDNLVAAVFNASPFPSYPYTILRTKDPHPIRLGCHTYDELEFHTFVLYNLDSAMDFNLKAKSKYGLMSILAHEVGHHAFHHFLQWPDKNIPMQELQADYFAGWLLAKLNVPQSDITKGLVVVAEEKAKEDYPSLKERSAATRLGYTVANSGSTGPLATLETGGTLSAEWLTKWCRTTEASASSVSLAEIIFTGVVLELDTFGQLIYSVNNKRYVIGRAMPSKDPRFAYLLFDNQFNYWWIEKDGTIKDEKAEIKVASVNLSILTKE